MKVSRRVAALLIGLTCSAPLFMPVPAYAGCGVSFTLANNHASPISRISYKRKSRAGSWTNWKYLYRSSSVGNYLETYDDFTTTITTNARCGAKRRYRFKVVTEDGNQWTQYYPGATTWTTTTELQIVLRP